MLLTLSWLYSASPVRVCNYYLLEEQQLLGSALFALALAIAAGWLPPLFLGEQQPGFSAPRSRSAELPIHSSVQ